VGTVRLLPSEVANLVSGLSEGLAQLAREPAQADAPEADGRRLQELERRLAGLESRVARPGWREAVSAVAERVRGAARGGQRSNSSHVS
jgi:hypothetical protein